MPSHFSLARQHDAAGRHDEAINSLALGTQAGEPACTRELGKRLLTGDRAPLLAAEGAGFLLEAAGKGDAEATARVASLTALGLYTTQSWEDALRWLTLAAERGWQPARGQLAALAKDGTQDPAAWQMSPAVRDLSANPRVSVVEGFLGASVCGWIIEHARGRLVRARVYDAANEKTLVTTTRTNSVANSNLGEVELLELLVQARMSAACGLPMHNMEAPAVLHYAIGQQITEHYDFVDPQTPDYAKELARNGQRVMTFLVYLNDDYDGGKTGFPTLGVSHKGRRGEGLFFVNALPDLQPDLRMVHTGQPPTRGEKWIVSQFIRSRPTITTPAPLRR
jgi:prolyl 4-hydroxylase